MNLRRTLLVAAACAALFGASFAAGNALLDDDNGPAARPTGYSPPAESAARAARPRPAPALGRAANLPGLRTPPRPANPPSEPATAQADAPSTTDAPAETAPSAPSE